MNKYFIELILIAIIVSVGRIPTIGIAKKCSYTSPSHPPPHQEGHSYRNDEGGREAVWKREIPGKLHLDPRPGDEGQLATLPKAPRLHQRVEERIGLTARDVRDRLGPKAGDSAIMVPRLQEDRPHSTVLPQRTSGVHSQRLQTSGKPAANRPHSLAAHKTSGHLYESCNKPGHTEAPCWSAHIVIQRIDWNLRP